MTYVIDTRPLGYDGRPLCCGRAATIVLAGCGGTGSFLADAICRLRIGWEARVFLVDMDRVEPRNVGRQAFDRREVGRFKAEALAERLARRYGREVGYSVEPYDRGHTPEPSPRGGRAPSTSWWARSTTRQPAGRWRRHSTGAAPTAGGAG